MRAVKSLLSEHPVLSGQFSKSRIEPLVNRINKSSIKRTRTPNHHPVCPPQGGLGRLDTALHCLLSPTLLRSTTLPSSRTQSAHRFLGRPLFLVPVSLSLHSVDHLTNSSSSFLFFSLHVPVPSQSAFSNLLFQFRHLHFTM